MTTPFPFSDDTVLDAADLNALGTWDSTTWQTGTTVEGITVGSGTETALFTRIGDGTDVGLVFYWYQLIWSTGTTITGNPYLHYPIEATTSRQGANWSCCFFESAASADYYGRLYRNGSLRGTIRAYDSSSTYLDGTNITNTVPFTWNIGDRLVISGYYRPGV